VPVTTETSVLHSNGQTARALNVSNALYFSVDHAPTSLLTILNDAISKVTPPLSPVDGQLSSTKQELLDTRTRPAVVSAPLIDQVLARDAVGRLGKFTLYILLPSFKLPA